MEAPLRMGSRLIPLRTLWNKGDLLFGHSEKAEPQWSLDVPRPAAGPGAGALLESGELQGGGRR